MTFVATYNKRYTRQIKIEAEDYGSACKAAQRKLDGGEIAFDDDDYFCTDVDVQECCEESRSTE